MDLHGRPHRNRDFTGHTCELHPAAKTRQAAALAIARAEQAFHEGRLLSPDEAMVLAGPEARKDETLYSIARAVAWETECDVDEILCRLGERFPELS